MNEKDMLNKLLQEKYANECDSGLVDGIKTPIAPVLDFQERTYPFLSYVLGQSWVNDVNIGPNGEMKTYDYYGGQAYDYTAECPESDCCDRVDTSHCIYDFKLARFCAEVCEDEINLEVNRQAGDAQGGGLMGSVEAQLDKLVADHYAHKFALGIMQGDPANHTNQIPGMDSIESIFDPLNGVQVIDLGGQKSFEAAMDVLKARIMRITGKYSSGVWLTTPEVHSSLMTRAGLDSQKSKYTVSGSEVRYKGDRVIWDNLVYTDVTNPAGPTTKIMWIPDGHIGAKTLWTAPRESVSGEQQGDFDACGKVCKRIHNHATLLARGLPALGMIINVRPFFGATIASGLTNAMNPLTSGVIVN